ncbi:hypothetical protein TTHERM_000075961 (macronuclear) [Tetrahymena thermophila SB210]|uniref:Uncharacterized protein n=1 Tax=Tetrahymena thermophila (strain SB210) TaxID=312017 RepID=W7XI97_TETTS|nr:hypothetical protein TTHERM_000075961 [Tetrahymena thermophila SB210]EWS74436.1 hypothetical protein TTHERM_000075961 [Tetrahymena thermophila SB210]|eukprot:XP_012653013.1 hypothetical protein TTHERM_000075961 [Tetrahymena thermophila SB210]
MLAVNHLQIFCLLLNKSHTKQERKTIVYIYYNREGEFELNPHHFYEQNSNFKQFALKILIKNYFAKLELWFRNTIYVC